MNTETRNKLVRIGRNYRMGVITLSEMKWNVSEAVGRAVGEDEACEILEQASHEPSHEPNEEPERWDGQG